MQNRKESQRKKGGKKISLIKISLPKTWNLPLLNLFTQHSPPLPDVFNIKNHFFLLTPAIQKHNKKEKKKARRNIIWWDVEM